MCISIRNTAGACMQQHAEGEKSQLSSVLSSATAACEFVAQELDSYGSRRYMGRKPDLVAEGSAVAPIAPTQLVSPMPQQQHPRPAPKSFPTAMQLALGLCSHP